MMTLLISEMKVGAACPDCPPSVLKICVGYSFWWAYTANGYIKSNIGRGWFSLKNRRSPLLKLSSHKTIYIYIYCVPIYYCLHICRGHAPTDAEIKFYRWLHGIRLATTSCITVITRFSPFFCRTGLRVRLPAKSGKKE